MNNINILAVIVTFNPEISTVIKLCNNLVKQVKSVLLIDNCSSLQLELKDSLKDCDVSIIANKENYGLGRAYNQALEHAISHEYTHIILFDQDSMPSDNMVAELLLGMKSIDNERVACVGPNYSDIKVNSTLPFVKLEGLSFKRQRADNNLVIETDHLISSGCLIPLSVILEVGRFNEDLFIDFIDIEWCLRARHFGYKSYGVISAAMSHNIGENSIKIFNKTICLHSPMRLYYQFRNQIWIIKRRNFSYQYRLALFIRMLKLLALFAALAPNRIPNFRFIFKGIIDGIQGKMGRY